ncbi:MAG: SDR family NAD(P)-dependent oxidoreductase, partial [Actinomycetes bacterium]
MFDLSGRVVVITGGNGGIGLGMARALAGAGAEVAVWGRDATKNDAAVAELTGLGTRVSSQIVDVVDPEQVRRAMEGTVEAHGRVDSLFANAGTFGPAPFLTQTLDGWRRVVEVNLDGAFLCLQAAATQLVEQGEGGSLVAVSSTSA